jgi:pimeloyl-ACP methyl ester carboxylesterase
LYFARLTGHGRPGTALAEASVGDWTRDMAEAAAIGRRIGKRVILTGTSTGATLISAFAADPARLQDVAGLVLIAPNYRIKAAGSSLLTLPFARYYLPLIMGKTRSWTGMNEGHNTYWTREYPVEALLPLAAIVKETEAMDFAEIALPALFVYAPIDPTVDHSRTEEVIADWGGPVETQVFDIPAAEADTAHVITGDIVSPMRTAPVTARIIDWAEGLAQ